jgi:tetratricopeptide (TPR) repeat protein
LAVQPTILTPTSPGNVVPADQLRQQYYSVRDVRSLYPTVRDDHLRYLEKLGLVQPAARVRGDRYYGFAALAIIRQVSGALEQGLPLRQALRMIEAERKGQLAFDFEPRGRTDARLAKVVALDRAGPIPGGSAPVLPVLRVPDAQARLAAKYFLEGASLDGSDDQREEAAGAYRKALVVDPDLVPALVNLANIHYACDRLIEAQALYERAIRLEPDCFEANFNLGNIHHDMGRYEDALGCYEEAVGLNPTYADAHFYLAVTLEKLGRSPDARPHWRIYRQLSPDGEWVELAKEFSD